VYYASSATVVVVVVVVVSHCSVSVYRTLCEVLSNFPNSLEEVTLKAESAGITMKNYVDEHESKL